MTGSRWRTWSATRASTTRPIGEDNRDGHGENYSDNLGVEGPTDDAEIVRAARARRKRNMMATLMLSQGTPMILAGDEIGNTQGGNNNAYCAGQRDRLDRLGGGGRGLPCLHARR